MATTLSLNNAFYRADDIKYLTFQGNDVDELTINGNTVLLPLDYTATLPGGSSLPNNTVIRFPVTKSKLARGLLLSYHVRKTSSTGKATFNLAWSDGSSGPNYNATIHKINMTASSPNDTTYSVWYNGNVCMLGEGPILPNWTSAYQGGTYVTLIIGGVSNLYLVEPMTIRVISDWTSREEEDTSTTTTTTTTATTAAANADAYGFTLIDE